MSDIATPASAPAVTETPQAPVTQTPAPIPSPTVSDELKGPSKLAKDLSNLLTAPTEDLENPKPKKVEEKKPEPAPAAEPATPAATEKPIKVKKAKQPEEVRPPLPSKVEAAPAAPASTPVAPAKSTKEEDEEFEKSLVENEQAVLDDAKAAERYLGDKYKGHTEKMRNFLKEAAKKAEDPNLDEDDYQKWYSKEMPKISQVDLRSIERQRVKEEVTKEVEPKLEAERHSRWVDSEIPKIKERGNQIFNKLIASALPAEMASAVAERTKGITDRAEYIKAVQAVEQDYKLEKEITENIVSAATNDLEEFHKLTTTNPSTGKPIAQFNDKNPQHERIIKMVSDMCEYFKNTGGAELKRNGKWFVTRSEWSTLTPDQRGQFWTFTNEDLVSRAMGSVKGVVENAVSAQRKALEERGYRRTIAPHVAPQPAPAPIAGSPPAPRPAPPPTGNTPAQPTLSQLLAARLNSPQPGE